MHRQKTAANDGGQKTNKSKRISPKKKVAPATPQSRANKIKNEKLRNDVPMGARTFASSQNSNGRLKNTKKKNTSSGKKNATTRTKRY